MLRHVDGVAHGRVDLLADAFGEAGIGVFSDVDADEWHWAAPWGQGTPLTLEHVGQIESLGDELAAVFV
ncbi:hypothetical protein GCM10009103_25650 [Pseudomonas koreensis]|nr:hypothetical protein GCM10009103_25650 [Pseudomonas koreensis]